MTTRVLPVPAPARTKSGPVSVLTASRWAALSDMRVFFLGLRSATTARGRSGPFGGHFPMHPTGGWRDAMERLILRRRPSGEKGCEVQERRTGPYLYKIGARLKDSHGICRRS